jgi:chemotaxis protein CheD
MALIIVGISEMKISSCIDDVLATYSLGSCIGISVYDPKLNIGGMLHCMLPLSKIDPEKSKYKPAMFVDSGLTALLTDMFKMGARKSRLVINVAGGAHVLDSGNKIFKIGERNFTVVRKMLWKNGLLMHVQDVGGIDSRTIFLDNRTGTFTVKSQGVRQEYPLPGPR